MTSKTPYKRKREEEDEEEATTQAVPKWIAIHARKGGVGKTQATIQLANLLSTTNKILVIDSDSQCNITNFLLPVPKDGKMIDRDFVTEFKDHIVPKTMKLKMIEVRKRKENPRPAESPFETVLRRKTHTLRYDEYWGAGVDMWSEERYDSHGAVQCSDNKNIFVVPGSHKSTAIDARISIIRALTKVMPDIIGQLITFVENFEHLAQTLGCTHILVDLPPSIGAFGSRVLTMASAVISISLSNELRNGAFSLESIAKMPWDFDSFMNADLSDHCSEEGALSFLKSHPQVTDLMGLRIHPSKKINWVGHIQNLINCDKDKKLSEKSEESTRFDLDDYKSVVLKAAEEHHKSNQFVKTNFKIVHVKAGATALEWRESLSSLLGFVL